MQTEVSSGISRHLAGIEIWSQDRAQPIYSQAGRLYVPATKGESYEIVVQNKTGSRILVVESVDGRNVLKDEPASVSGEGMVLRAYGSWRNQGWRLDDDTVRKFVFTDAQSAIATQAGAGESLGVIGIAVFREKQDWRDYNFIPKYPPAWLRVHSRMTFSADRGLPTPDVLEEASINSLSDERIGTGMGEEIRDHVGRTHFERNSLQPETRIEIYYRSFEWLKANGIISESYSVGATSAFPADGPDETGYRKYVK